MRNKKWFVLLVALILLFSVNLASADAARKTTNYKQATFKLNYEANGGGGTMSASLYPAGTTFNLPRNSYTRSGYIFAGWSTSAGGTPEYRQYAAYTMPFGGATLYATWNPVQQTLSYEANGGGGTMSASLYPAGTTFNLPRNSYTRSGYIFAGWSTTASGAPEYRQYATYTMPSGGATLYATWNPVVVEQEPVPQQTLSYQANGGSGTMSVSLYPAGTTFNLPRNSYTRSGYIFAGWSTTASGTPQYRQYDTYTMPSGGATLYATWNPVVVEQEPVQEPAQQQTLTYQANGGSGTMSASLYPAGTTFNLTRNSYTRSDYTFAGWSTTAGGTVQYSDGATYTMPSVGATLYASWIPVVVAKLPLFAESFESTTLDSSWGREYATTDHSPRIVSTYVASGSKSLRVELWNSDPLAAGSKRAEITRRREGPREEHWYHFSTYLPAGGTEDYATDPKSSEILAQWHNVPDSGEEWTSPPLSLHTVNGNWKIQRWWDDAALTSNSQMLAKKFYANHDLGSYAADKGKWTQWSFHVRWGWLASQNPILEVYKNGVLVLNENGKPNMTNDQNGVYMKLGVYKWEWNQSPSPSILTKRVVYFDAISVE